MRIKLSLLALALSLTLLSAVALGAGSLTIEEANLLGYSDPYEVNASATGGVLISDLGPGAIWDIAPSGVYTRYELLTDIADARPDDDGAVWWSDYVDGFGWLDRAASTATQWTLGTGHNLGGLAFDQEGRVWLTQFYGDAVFRFDPATTEVCTYTIGAPSFYVVASGASAWFANWGDDRITRLDPDQSEATWWPIPGADPYPLGLALDENGTLWWADRNQGHVARLDPSLDRITAYTLPLGTQPQMIALRDGQVWVTEASQGSITALDPSLTTGITTTVMPTEVSLTPDCSMLGPGTTSGLTPVEGSLDWSTGTLTPTLEQEGWTVYALPSGSEPYGLADSGGYLWLADQGRDKLARLRPATAPIADFTATPVTGTVPLTVTFTDRSSGDISSYQWTFGDGGTSTQESPNHSYTTTGVYTVSLTVDGPGGSDTLTRTHAITVYHWADVTQDCRIDAADVQTVAGAWRCADGEGCYDPAYDFDGDGVISVVDIVRVVVHWGCGCGDPCYTAGPLETAAQLPLRPRA